MKNWCFALLILLAACQKSCPSKNPRQELKTCMPSDPATFDSRKGGDRYSSMVHFLLYDGLTRLKSDGQVELALAEKVDISSDRMTYTFKLRPARWSNGQSITARDFELSWKAILDPSFPAVNAHLFYPIKNAEAVKKGALPASELGLKSADDRTLVVTLAHPTPYFLELISFCVFFPINRNLGAEWEKNVEANCVASGPFLLESWKPNNEIVLVKNPHYYHADRIRLPAIHISMVGSENTALQMYEKGDLDILGMPLMNLPTEAIPELAKTGELHVFPVGATTFCSFNVNQFPFTNVNIRKAFALAMNRQEIVENVTQLAEEPALGVVPPIVKKTPQTSFFKDSDVQQAAALFEKGLAELELTRETFPRLTYYYNTSELQHKVAQALQQQWQSVLGIQINLQNLEYKTLMQAVQTHAYEFAQCNWMVQYHDPMNVLERYKYASNVKNYSGWESKAFIDCLNRSDIAKTTEERNAILEEAERLIVDEMPLAPIYHWSSAFVSKDYVKSFGLAPIGNGYFEQISMAQ